MSAASAFVPGAASSTTPSKASSTASAAAIEVRVEDVARAYGGAAALRGVSLTVGAGELVALLGPSGSGKTTLLRTIAGLEVPDAGRVLFDGQDATALPVQRRGVGFVFQHYALFRHLSVFENVAYGLRARPRPARPDEGEIRARVGALLDLVQLAGHERRRPAQLSGGQRQRVALARALAVEPRVLLMDEPFGALDAGVRRDLRRWLRGVHERTGRTTIFVTHDQDEALELADRVAVLHQGRLEQIGTPDEVRDAPATPFVTTFVGVAARFPVLVANGRAALAGRAPQAEPLAVEAAGVPDGPAILYCRPWDLALAPPDAGAPLAGTVRLLRRLGSARIVEVELDDGARLEVESRDEAAPAPGARVGLAVRGGRLFQEVVA